MPPESRHTGACLVTLLEFGVHRARVPGSEPEGGENAESDGEEQHEEFSHLLVGQ